MNDGFVQLYLLISEARFISKCHPGVRNEYHIITLDMLVNQIHFHFMQSVRTVEPW